MQAQGDAIIFADSMGNAAFVSHQWVSRKHPDPEFRQMQVLQGALRRVLTCQGSVPLDYVTEGLVPGASRISFQEFQSRPLFLWYDYFSVPQLETRQAYVTDDGDGSDQAQAITSIPAYIANCRYFFALCPTIESPLEGSVLNACTWARRGWCRVERASRELSEHHTWILVESSTSLQIVGTAISFVSGSVGEGEFAVESDRAKLAQVMQTILKRKLRLSLQAGDLPSYRRHLNLQSVHLRGLDAEPLHGLVPDLEPGTGDVVAGFLLQNGFMGVGHKDAAGWRPLHYAALSGNVQLIEGLLLQRANPSQRTAKDEPELGFPPWVSALDLAVFYKHNDIARLLINARARLKGGIIPTIHQAATSDNADGIRLLCEAGGDIRVKNPFGASVFVSVAGYGARAALEECLRQARPSMYELSLTLFCTMITRGGSAEMAGRLLELRANVDHQYDAHRDANRLGLLAVTVRSLQYRFGRDTVGARLAYHLHGCTPLMAALQSAQYEGAAALIAANARLDLKNCRGWTAIDFARDQSIPQFLQRGLKGDPFECRKVASLALPDGYVEVPF